MRTRRTANDFIETVSTRGDQSFDSDSKSVIGKWNCTDLAETRYRETIAKESNPRPGNIKEL